MLDMISQQW